MWSRQNEELKQNQKMEETATHPQGYESLGCPNLWHNYAQSKFINIHEFSLINIRIFSSNYSYLPSLLTLQDWISKLLNLSNSSWLACGDADAFQNPTIMSVKHDWCKNHRLPVVKSQIFWVSYEVNCILLLFLPW